MNLVIVYMFDFDKLLEDIKNKSWKDRIIRSINSVLSLYNLSLHDVIITRKELSPDELLVAAEEECNLEKSKEFKEKHTKIPPPITVIQHRYKKVIFLGSNRAIQYVLHERNPDCIIIKLPNHLHPKMVFEAKISLKELIEKQK